MVVVCPLAVSVAVTFWMATVSATVTACGVALLLVTPAMTVDDVR